MRNEGRQGYLFCLRGFRELKKFRSVRGDFPAAVVESILICGGRNENHFRGIFRVVKKFVGTPFFAVRVVRSFQIFGGSENLDFVFSAPQVQVHRHSAQKKIRALIFVRDAGNRNPFVSRAGRSARNVVSVFVLEQNSAADLIYVKRIFRAINYQFPRIVPNVLSVQSESRNKKNRGECNLFQWHDESNSTTKNACKQAFDLRCKLMSATQAQEKSVVFGRQEAVNCGFCVLVSQGFRPAYRVLLCNTRRIGVNSGSSVSSSADKEFGAKNLSAQFCGKEFGARNSSAQFVGKEFCATNSSARFVGKEFGVTNSSAHFGGKIFFAFFRSPT